VGVMGIIGRISPWWYPYAFIISTFGPKVVNVFTNTWNIIKYNPQAGSLLINPAWRWAAQRGTTIVRGPVGQALGQLWRYPQVMDPRTGRAIQFPTQILQRVDRALRVNWGSIQRGEFIKEWYRRGYSTPAGGWDKYDIHHILPREFGGQNDFWNLVPVERTTHGLFNEFWRYFF
jgi:hypothetical protein